MTAWSATDASRAAARQAPRHPVPPSYQQRGHLLSYRRNLAAGRDMARICYGAWNIPGRCDVAAMTATINDHLRRHDAYHGWFASVDGEPVRHQLTDPAVIEFRPADLGAMDTEQIRDHLLRSVPDPWHWDCFGFGVIQRDDHFTVYIAVDHLVSDGMSAGVIFAELHLGYAGRLAGAPLTLPAPGSYLQHCADEHTHTAALTRESADVRAWLDFVAAGGGELPDFPLPLGDPDITYRGAMLVVPLLDAVAAERFEAVCEAAGARFSGGVFAAAALAEQALTGSTHYRGLTPYDTRSAPADYLTPGWFASVIPVAAPVGGRSFGDVAAAAQRSFDAAKPLARVPLARVLELAAAGDMRAPTRDVPLLSFLDGRKVPLTEQWDALGAGIYGDSRSSDQVCMWVNRFAAETTLAISFPDNPIARDSVARYLDAVTAVYREVVAAPAAVA
ncbi:condensation domain-containing protein [Mycobacterium sp. MYCO198283]|uniref:condensation domain-containing protein n=1 Tax=Mycobacterium sp. MYCO198283 TaxID=2883505 RepID=UPI001E2F9662|nr:condensation domain-containing protein [Mycobacterium sp. MYCO198283]MCG5432989.1 condensation domain-containing protein [Mycobacterium sp. MYCO198283]